MKRGCYSLCGHEEHAEHLADAGEATRVNLADVYRVRLEELFEHHPVMRVLARRNANPMRLQRATDGCVSKDIVRRRRFLNEPTVERTTNCQSDFIPPASAPGIGWIEEEYTHQGLISASEET